MIEFVAVLKIRPVVEVVFEENVEPFCRKDNIFFGGPKLQGDSSELRLALYREKDHITSEESDVWVETAILGSEFAFRAICQEKRVGPFLQALVLHVV